jgi:hypothetical protein
MLAEFFEVLSRIRSLQKGQQFQEAGLLTDEEFQRIVGHNKKAVANLSETELLAQLIKGETTLAVREKTLMLVTLLKEAGDIAAGEAKPEESRSYYLKGLHLLTGVLAREEVSDFPDFVPRIESFLGALGDSPLPITTEATLMQHYERLGDFARAEDKLFSMIEIQPDNLGLMNFAVGFYERMQQKSDAVLIAGNLPRAEVETGLAQVLANVQTRTAKTQNRAQGTEGSRG